MPKPTAAEAMALLKETVAAGRELVTDPLVRWDGLPNFEGKASLERVAPGLVAELYDGANAQHPACNRGPCRLCDARSACEDALVAWAEGVAVPRDATEPQRGG